MKYRLKDICSITKGVTGIMKAIPGKYPMVALSDERRSHNEFQFDAKAVIVPLISSTGHGHASMKRVHYQEGKFALGNILCAVIPKDETQLNAKFLHLYLNQLKETLLVPLMKGAANVSLPMNKLADVEIEVPRLERQMEIIEVAEKTDALRNELDQRLINQEIDVAKLRQSFLREAMQGKLVKQDPKDQPASELLKEIQAGKERLIKSGKINKQKELPPIKPEEVPYEVPEGWVWTRLGEVSQINGGFAFKSSAYVNDGVRVIRISDFDEQGFKNDKIVRYSFSDKLNEFILEENNIIMAMTGGTVGKSLLVKTLPEKMVVNQRVATIKIGPVVLPSFINSLIQTDLIQSVIQKAKNSTNDNISMSDITGFLVPLPPLSEQHRIVKKLEELMKYCDELEKNIQQSKSENEKLLQQVLREALSGEIK